MNDVFPHDTWGNYYDFVYESCFGHNYTIITQNTLNFIRNYTSVGRTLLDFGAGTGRIAIPLAEDGFNVHAVEPSLPMLNKLAEKALLRGVNIQLHNSTMSDFTGEQADHAIAIFNVLTYITTEEDLISSIKNVSKHLQTGGRFQFDLPLPVAFQNMNFNSEHLTRDIEISKLEHDLYLYHEECSGIFNGILFEYLDEFNIRCWRYEQVHSILIEAGLNRLENTPPYDLANATYYTYEKIRGA